MKLQQIRNATLKIYYGTKTILLDPWLKEKGTGFSAPTVNPEMSGMISPLDALPLSPSEILNDVDFCLITHIHPDHFTPDYLPKGMPLVVQNTADKQKLLDMGFTNVLAFQEKTLKMIMWHQKWET